MALKILDQGMNNRVNISARMREAGNGTITLQGNDNIVEIADSDYNFGAYITLNQNCTLKIGANINCYNLVTYQANDATLEIGTTVGFNGIVRLSMHEPGRLAIGDGCLFADQVEMSISDMHSIIDATTRTRLNPAKDIIIGNRVWIGSRSLILKGITIGDGAIVGAMSVVTRNVPPLCVVAGNPAKIVRENATWDFTLL
jgi:acetyltransferase-like isoleucine patch superfamily enzyme